MRIVIACRLLAAAALVLPAIVVSPTRADEAFPPNVAAPWGKFVAVDEGEPESRIGYFEKRPEDGKFVVPSELPPIAVAGKFDGQPLRRYYELEWSPEREALFVLLPKEGDASDEEPSDASAIDGKGGVDAESESGIFDAIVAEKTTQILDGRIVFPATSARIVGQTAKLESDGTHHRVGFWTNADDYVVWPYEATRWGRYRALLTYSSASPDGGVATIEFGGETIDVELPSTGSWHRYRTIEAGNLYLATAGKQELVVRAKKFSGAALMNLKAVVLLPTHESDRVPQQAGDGTVTLHARDAVVRGTKLRYEPKPEKNTLGYWTEQKDQASWRFELDRPGAYDVELLIGCGTGQGGSSILVFSGDGDGIGCVVEETGGFQNFVPRVIGQVRYDVPGTHYLTVLPTEIAKAAACDIRQVRLIPAKDGAESIDASEKK